jgi:hypothetical protein
MYINIMLLALCCCNLPAALQDHAQQQAADAPEESFEDEWAALPPEVMAMVAALQAKQ